MNIFMGFFLCYIRWKSRTVTMPTLSPLVAIATTSGACGTDNDDITTTVDFHYIGWEHCYCLGKTCQSIRGCNWLQTKFFSTHSSVCKKAARQLNALTRISNYLDVSARRMIYNSFVASNFNYYPLVWHFCGISNSNKMEKIQERCLRIVYNHYNSSPDRLLEMANTTSLVISRLRILLLEVYKSIHHWPLESEVCQ